MTTRRTINTPVLELHFTQFDLPDFDGDDFRAEKYFDNEEYCNKVRALWLASPIAEQYLSIVFERMWEFEKFFPFIERCFPGIVAMEFICNNYLSRSDDKDCTFEGIPKTIQYLRWVYGRSHEMTLDNLHLVKWLDFGMCTAQMHWANHCRGRPP